MMPIDLAMLAEKIESLTGTRPVPFPGIRGDQTFEIPGGDLTEIIKYLSEDDVCCHLSTITAQQRKKSTDEIEVLYHFWQGTGFSFLIRLPGDAAELPSISTLLPGADCCEREVAEMFGMHFVGRDETPPLFLPDDWAVGPPFSRHED